MKICINTSKATSDIHNIFQNVLVQQKLVINEINAAQNLKAT